MVIWTGAVGKIANTAGTATAAGKVGTGTLTIDKVSADTTVACSIGAAHFQLTLDTYGGLQFAYNHVASMLFVQLAIENC